MRSVLRKKYWGVGLWRYGTVLVGGPDGNTSGHALLEEPALKSWPRGAGGLSFQSRFAAKALKQRSRLSWHFAADSRLIAVGLLSA